MGAAPGLFELQNKLEMWAAVQRSGTKLQKGGMQRMETGKLTQMGERRNWEDTGAKRGT